MRHLGTACVYVYVYKNMFIHTYVYMCVHMYMLFIQGHYVTDSDVLAWLEAKELSFERRKHLPQVKSGLLMHYTILLSSLTKVHCSGG